MTVQAPAVRRTARPDPFGLPSATGSRFVLLLVVAGVGMMFLYFMLLDSDPALPLPVIGGLDCGRDLMAGIRAGAPDVSMAFYDCNQLKTRWFAGYVLLSVPALALVTVIVYRLYPRLIERRLKTVDPAALAGVVPDAVLAELAGAAEKAGRPVRLLVAVDRPTTGGRAYGCRPHYRVVLDLGLLVQAGRHPGRLRAVLTHELMHVRNRDIDLTYLAMAVWWASLVVGGVPLAAAMIARPGIIGPMWWRAALLLALIWYARAAVLRTREFYADQRAAQWEGAALRETLGALRERDRAWRFLSYHPAARTRLAVLDDAAPLFRLEAGDCLAMGVLIGIAFSPMLYIVGMLADYDEWTASLVGLVFGSLLAGSIGGSIWRRAHHGLADGHPTTGILPGAAALATGIVAGQLISPEIQVDHGLADLLTLAPLHTVVVISGLFAWTYVALRWIALTASAWLPVARHPRRVYLAGSVVAAFVLSDWLAFWFRLQLLMDPASEWWMVVVKGVTAAVLHDAMLVAVVVALVYPAVAWGYPRFVRRRNPSIAWQPVPVPLALGIALVTAVAATFVLLVFRDAVGAGSSVMPAFSTSLLMAVVTLVVICLVAGFAFGGRHRTSRLVVCAGLAALVLTPYILSLTALHVRLVLECGSRDVFGCAQGLRVAPLFESGYLFRQWFSALGLGATTAIALGSGVRAGVDRLRGFAGSVLTVPARGSAVRGGVVLLPVVATGALLVHLVAAPIFTPSTTLAESLPGIIARETVPEPESWTRDQACASIGRSLSSASPSALLEADPALLTGAALQAIGSDDPVLARFGRDAADLMRAGDASAAYKVPVLVLRYCD
ncbi:M48 family metalloprotease [Herbidospora sp. RD11066]